MPHLLACRTKGDHRGVDRVAVDAAEDVRNNHPHSRSARRHSPSVHRRCVIPVARPRVMRAQTDDRRGAAPRVRDLCALRMRSARGRRA
jgi:hypothetical protein